MKADEKYNQIADSNVLIRTNRSLYFHERVLSILRLFIDPITMIS